jgi:hypothetical protein
MGAGGGVQSGRKGVLNGVHRALHHMRDILGEMVGLFIVCY